MKEFLIGNATCYEFQASEILIDNVLANIENENVEYKKISLNQNNSPTMGYEKSEYGYTSFYHEELYNFLNACIKQVGEKKL